MSTTKKRYDIAMVMQAIDDVEVKGLSLRSTSNKYGISRETLRSQIARHKNGLKLNLTPGPAPVLSDEEESVLFKWMFDCSARGFHLPRSEIGKCVQKFLNANGRKTVFKDNQPQRRWFNQFNNRHPELRELPKLTKFEFKTWFSMIDELVFKQSDELRSIVQNPDRIFIAEEVRFSLNPNGVNISAATTMTMPDAIGENIEIVENLQNKSISILLNFNAAGEAGPPQIVYPLEEIPNEISETIPSAWGVGKNRTGLIDEDLFYNYIENVLVPYLTQYNVQLPVILLVNPDLTPISFKLFELCRKEKIVLLGLYQLACGILGRCRVSSLNILENWLAYHPYSEFQMDQLTAMVNLFFEHSTSLSWSLVEEFQFCGLFPWNADLVDERHLTACEQQFNKSSKTKLSKSSTKQEQHLQLESQQDESIPSSMNQADTLAAINSISHGQVQMDLQFPFEHLQRYHRPQTSTVSTSTDDCGPMMSYAQFCEIVGQTLVDHCQKTSASKEFDLGRDNLIILRKLSNFFQTTRQLSSSQQASSIVRPHQLRSLPSMELSNDSSSLPTTTTMTNGHDASNSELSLVNFLSTKRRPPSQRPPVLVPASKIKIERPPMIPDEHLHILHDHDPNSQANINNTLAIAISNEVQASNLELNIATYYPTTTIL